MGYRELKEAVEDVVNGRAKMGEVAYGDDGVDMAKDMLEMINLADKGLEFIELMLSPSGKEICSEVQFRKKQKAIESLLADDDGA